MIKTYENGDKKIMVSSIKSDATFLGIYRSHLKNLLDIYFDHGGYNLSTIYITCVTNDDLFNDMFIRLPSENVYKYDIFIDYDLTNFSGDFISVLKFLNWANDNISEDFSDADSLIRGYIMFFKNSRLNYFIGY